MDKPPQTNEFINLTQKWVQGVRNMFPELFKKDAENGHIPNPHETPQ